MFTNGTENLAQSRQQQCTLILQSATLQKSRTILNLRMNTDDIGLPARPCTAHDTCRSAPVLAILSLADLSAYLPVQAMKREYLFEF